MDSESKTSLSGSSPSSAREPASAIRVHAAPGLHPDDRSEAAFPDLGLDHREQIVGDIRFAGEIRVARDVEGVACLDVHAREQEIEVSRDHLFQRDEAIEPANADEAWNSCADRHLDAGGGRLLLLVVQRHEQIEGEVRYERKRVRRVDCLRRHQRHDVLDVVGPERFALLLAQVRVVENLDPVLREAAEHLGEHPLLASLDPGDDLLGLVNLLLRRASVDGELLYAGTHLLLEPADALHEELVQVRAHDGQELHALQKGGSLVLGLIQDAAVELEPGELAVQVQGRVLEIDLGIDLEIDLRGRWRGLHVVCLGDVCLGRRRSGLRHIRRAWRRGGRRSVGGLHARAGAAGSTSSRTRPSFGWRAGLRAGLWAGLWAGLRAGTGCLRGRLRGGLRGLRVVVRNPGDRRTAVRRSRISGARFGPAHGGASAARLCRCLHCSFPLRKEGARGAGCNSCRL